MLRGRLPGGRTSPHPLLHKVVRLVFTSIQNRERRCGVIEDSAVPIASELELTVFYCTFQMDWEIVEKRDGYEVAYRWFGSRKKAGEFCRNIFNGVRQVPIL